MDGFFVYMDYYKLKVLNNRKKIIIAVSLVSISILLVYYYFFNHSGEEILNDLEITNNDVPTNSNDSIYVDIKGQVNTPGVYSFNIDNNARINDLIEKAGGLTKDADTSLINLSKKLEDEMTIIIYSKKEIDNYVKTQNDLEKKLEICETKLKKNACIKEKNETTGNKININKATLDELITIPGIGEAKAKAIIEYRSRNKFNSIEDIKNVEGIGENLFASIKESITV